MAAAESKKIRQIFESIEINKNRVFSIIGLNVNSPVYNQVLREYSTAKEIFNEIKNIQFEYLVEEKIFMDCSHIVYAGITLGNDVSEYVTRLFDESNYSRAIILNAVCDDFIMQADNILRCVIYDYCKLIGINAVKKYSPHENLEPMWAKVIAEKLRRLNVAINDEFNAKPEKTLLYVVSADKYKRGNIKHNCSSCNTKCKWAV